MSENEKRDLIEVETPIETSSSRAILPKDMIAIAISSLALLLSALGVWFNFFRETSHLKMVVSQAFFRLEEEVHPFAQFDAQSFSVAYSIVFFNDGNRDIVVTSISQSLAKVDAQQGEGDFGKGIFETTTADAQNIPVCKEGGGLNGLKEYESDGQKKSQGAFVVKAGQFYIMSKTTFYPMPIFTNVVPEGKTAILASCFKIEFVKPDSSAGSKSVPAAHFTLAKKRASGSDKLILTVAKGGPFVPLRIERVD